MASAKANPDAPQLPPGSIDFDALSAALAAGKDHETAIAVSLHDPEIQAAPASEKE